MKIDRLVAIIVVLLRKDRVPAKELAEKFGVSVRTILRDVDAINLAGIPIVTFQGAGGGIGVAEGYRLDKSLLTGDEMAAVIAALRGFDNAITGSRHEVLMEKLKNVLPEPQLARLDTRLKQLTIDLSPWHDDKQVKHRLAAIRQAIEAARLLDLSYIDFEGKKTHRRVEPYSLLYKGSGWYLLAWCTLREAFRYFRVTRIRDIQDTGQRYEPRELPAEPIAKDPMRESAREMTMLSLKFKRSMENIVLELFGDDVQQCDDGSMIVHTAMPEDNWLYGFLLSFGAEMEVLDPAHIRSSLAQVAQKIVQTYVPEHDI